jgi:hypothetical protein
MENMIESYRRAYAATAAAYSDAIANRDTATAKVMYDAANHLWSLANPKGEA